MNSVSVRRVALACVLLSSQACINDVDPGDSTIRGTYTLRTVGGAALPYTKSVVGTTKVELLDDKISLFLGGTFSEDAVERTTTDGVTTTQLTTTTGTYAPAFGNSVSINPNGGIGRTVIIDNGNTMSGTENGVSYVWKK